MEAPTETETIAIDYIYEPTREAVLAELLPRYIERQVYEWQMWVADFGEEGQRRLKGASVLISRCGGVGGAAARPASTTLTLEKPRQDLSCTLTCLTSPTNPAQQVR